MTMAIPGQGRAAHDAGCGHPHHHFVVEMVEVGMVEIQQPRLIYMVDENGVGQVLSTMPPAETAHYLRRAEEQANRSGSSRFTVRW